MACVNWVRSSTTAILYLFSQETDLLIKVIMKCVNIKLRDILGCFHYILNPPRMSVFKPFTVSTQDAHITPYIRFGVNRRIRNKQLFTRAHAFWLVSIFLYFSLLFSLLNSIVANTVICHKCRDTKQAFWMHLNAHYTIKMTLFLS